MSGEEIGQGYGFEHNREAVAHPMMPEERRRWYHVRQATPSLAYALMGVFDDVNPDSETEFSEEWFE